jgi:hypothetical protein
MVQLYDKETGAGLGAVTDAQFQSLQDHLEVESADDTDYYLTPETLDLLQEEGIDAAVLDLLRQGLGKREEMEIRWSRS